MNSNCWNQSQQPNQFLPFLVTQSQIHGIYTANGSSSQIATSTSQPHSYHSQNEGQNFPSEQVIQNSHEGPEILPGPSGLNLSQNSDVETLVIPYEDYQNNKEYIYRIKHNRSIMKSLKVAATEDDDGDDIGKKQMGPTCRSAYCVESDFRFCSTFTEDTRRKIFEEFWQILNWDQRHIFVATHVFKKPKNPDQTSDNAKVEIENDFIYTLRNSNGNDEQVCAEMFLNTLALTFERVLVWVQKYSIGGDGVSMYKEEFKKKLATIKIYNPNDYDENGLPKPRRKRKKKKSKREIESELAGENYRSREYDPNCPNKPSREKNTIKPEYWKCNIVKRLRMEGKEYYSKNSKTGEMVFHKGKDLGPRCTSSLCKISKLRNCDSISDKTREKIFNDIWQRWDWQQRKVWVASMVKRKHPSRKRTLSINSKRHSTLHYYLPDDNGIPVQVCRKMFISTTAIGHHQTLMWTNSYSLGSNFEENLISTKDADNHAIEWMDSLPKYSLGSDTGLKYIDPQFKTVGDLYKTYLERCKIDGIKPTEKYQIKRFVEHNNIGFVPQNDEECERCRLFSKNKDRDKSDETIKYHQARVEHATAEKSKDQKKAEAGVCYVLQIHLQPIKTVPILRNESQVFKSKLECNNLSIYDVKANYATCYFFSEDQCSNLAKNFKNIITTIICEHLKEYYLTAKKKLPIILYCNGTSDRTRNLFLSNALLNLATIHNVKITQKFFETGHSLVEDCYKTNQMLERFLNSKNKEIYLPSQLAKTVREIKRYPEIFTGIHLDFDYFRNYSNSEHLRYLSTHPGDGFEENDACEMQYNPTGKISLKLDFGGESMDLLQKTIKNFKPIHEYPVLYTEMASISKTKWDDLQDMKKFMPFDCQPFYDSLKYFDD
ncbi:uncharacterized protein LOC129613653 [Condylostylus longicornis]|uniref:uncharacterized protein LOC129613653 n=1 Tax=Condylostylus longicornis TaxID=2530218 RepID=UPI00244DB0AA|nr:uncharacterized protein LOC129613653 [Condylostylus longicornis]XP_055383784.1 uncharacterized protein LOC129613653 [Condylostylus longicornis]